MWSTTSTTREPQHRGGLAHCAEYDLDLWMLSILALKARSQLNQGHFETAAEVASQLADDRHDSAGAAV
jgi:hypothetical protein